ncbi:MAG: thioesterase family protein [Planctomycetota bacterium]|jgi:acyl-CoA thioester hydrolase|nr:thioesterase family protein [Planctomycetota bacterium]MEC9096108.1 thioesterase family protein [Planctomycetota bacterium]
MTNVNRKPMMIFESTVELRVRYQETDGQRRLHHANYINYFEIGRVELLRENGISYKALEDSGVVLVVAEVNCQYLLPADYDDLLSLTTRVTKSKGVRIFHEYEIRRGSDLICKGSSIIACVNADGHVSRLPKWLTKD